MRYESSGISNGVKARIQTDKKSVCIRLNLFESSYIHMEDFEKCKDYACRLLKYRSRSEKEIEDQLKRKKFSESEIRETIAWLKEKGYLNDERFAREWLESRKRRGYSEKYIRLELKQKGISEQLSNLDLNNQEQFLSDREVAEKLVEKKMKQYRNLEPVKVKQRIQNLLLRRGFSWEIIEEILRKNDYAD